MRARDKHDFECWALVLQRAIAWKGSKTDTFLNVGSNGVTEAMDLDLEGSDDEDILETLDNEEEFSKLRDQKREEVFKKLIELKALHDRLATQAPFSSESSPPVLAGGSGGSSAGGGSKKKKKDESDPQRFLQVSKEVMNMTAYFIGILENERDTWKNKYNVAVLERAQMEESLKLLARQHQRLEKKTTTALHTQVPDAHDGAPIESEPENEGEGVEDSGDEEFFDAIDTGPSFVMPQEEIGGKELVSRKLSTIDHQPRTKLPAPSP